MRTKPVTRDEIRLERYVPRILTAPTDAMQPGACGYYRYPIPKLWAPLLRSLQRTENREHPKLVERWLAAGLPVSKREPRKVAAPQCAYWPVTCQRCDRQFFYALHHKGKWCSDVCAEAAEKERRSASNAKMIKARSVERFEARSGRRCACCGALMEVGRSTKKFCSTHCRVKAARKKGDSHAT